MNILLIGDVHGEWVSLASVLAWHKPDICIALGDFGYWPNWPIRHPREEMYSVLAPVLQHTAIHFLDGNHEDHPELIKLAPRGSFEPVELVPNLVYQPRGSVMTLPDGRTILFAGGAKSVDWAIRTPGKTWFQEEILKRSHLPPKLPRVDIVMSHTLPRAFGMPKVTPYTAREYRWDITPDPTCEVLDKVLDKCRPSLWFAGHYHRRIEGKYGNTEYHVLDMLGCPYAHTDMDCVYWLEGRSVRAGRSGMAIPCVNGKASYLNIVLDANKRKECIDLSRMSSDIRAYFNMVRHLLNITEVVDADGKKFSGLSIDSATSFINRLGDYAWDARRATNEWEQFMGRV